MIKTLRESKAKLSELVNLASQGEEIVITVRGEPKARPCPVEAQKERRPGPWLRTLRTARARFSTGKQCPDSSPAILGDLREDRQ